MAIQGKKAAFEGARVLIVDRSRMSRVALREVLEQKLGALVVGEAQDGRSAVEMARELEPEVVILDVVLPGFGGHWAASKIRGEHPGVKVVVFTERTSGAIIRQMMQLGVSAYLLKGCPVSELTAALQKVVQGRTHFDDAVLERGRVPTLCKESLSPRQREVLQLLSDGRSTKEIADALDVSVKTVETHIRNIKQRLNLHSIASLTKYAIREGLTDLEA